MVNYPYQLKSKYARELLNNVTNNYSTHGWKLNNINMSETRARLGLRECLDKKVIRGLGLAYQKNSNIVLMKCSIAIQENSVYKLTGRKYTSIESHEKLSEELNKILVSNKRFDKRDEYLNI